MLRAGLAASGGSGAGRRLRRARVQRADDARKAGCFHAGGLPGACVGSCRRCSRPAARLQGRRQPGRSRDVRPERASRVSAANRCRPSASRRRADAQDFTAGDRGARCGSADDIRARPAPGSRMFARRSFLGALHRGGGGDRAAGRDRARTSAASARSLTGVDSPSCLSGMYWCSGRCARRQWCLRSPAGRQADRSRRATRR